MALVFGALALAFGALALAFGALAMAFLAALAGCVEEFLRPLRPRLLPVGSCGSNALVLIA